MAESPVILLERRDEVALILFNRPEKLNALSRECFDLLPEIVQQIREDTSVRAVVISGEGRAFSVGADLSPEAQATIHATRDERRQREHLNVFDSSTGWPDPWVGMTIRCPVVCALNGPAVGYAAELAVTADMRIAGESGRIGWVFTRRGMITDQACGPVLLPRVVGLSQAARLLYSGEVIGAQEMLRIGLVDEVVPDAQLRDRAVALAKHLAGGAPGAVATIKQQIYRAMYQDPHAIFLENRPAFGATMESEDFKEGVAAFLEKREPRWGPL